MQTLPAAVCPILEKAMETLIRDVLRDLSAQGSWVGSSQVTPADLGHALWSL